MHGMLQQDARVNHACCRRFVEGPHVQPVADVRFIEGKMGLVILDHLGSLMVVSYLKSLKRVPSLDLLMQSKPTAAGSKQASQYQWYSELKVS